jgi:hypothetical protein
MRKFIALLATAAGLSLTVAAQDVSLPVAADAIKFAVIGDNGTGRTPQYDVARRMVAARARFPFEFVIMLGDNMYGRQQPEDFITKFERPYASLLQAGVRFFAALGNHDDPDNRAYRGFNMAGERYYTFARGSVRFFVLDTNAMDPAQLAWIERALAESREPWKVCYFHHPLYSDGERHGPDVELRVLLEPLFVRHRVNLVFSGHEHFYERLVPQKGITYFIEGASGQLRRGNVRSSATVAAAFDEDQTFMLVEIAGDRASFQTISRSGRVVDSGVVLRQPTT